jgi:hypothetical protein
MVTSETPDVNDPSVIVPDSYVPHTGFPAPGDSNAPIH